MIRSPIRHFVPFLLGVVLPIGCGFLESEDDGDEFHVPTSLSSDSEEGEETDLEARIAKLEKDAARVAQARGERLYRYACATCHGAEGDGKGPSSEGLDPPPRDFTLGVYKWRSTESGSLPLDGDIFRTISRGVPGTTMVAWKDLLSERQRRELVEYVKSFSDRFEEEGVEEDEIVEVPDPVPATSESIARGKEVYEANKCWECHGRGGRGDGPSAATLKDSWGNPSKPFDFTLGRYRGGSKDRYIYRTFFTGLNGTPMPGYAETVPEEDRWPLVHYVQSLERKPGFLERIIFETP